MEIKGSEKRTNENAIRGDSFNRCRPRDVLRPFVNLFKYFQSIHEYPIPISADDQGGRGKGKKARREISVFNLTEREREEER